MRILLASTLCLMLLACSSGQKTVGNDSDTLLTPDSSEVEVITEAADSVEFPDHFENISEAVPDYDRFVKDERPLFPETNACAAIDPAKPFGFNACGFYRLGKYILLRGGTIQYFRLPESSWRDRLTKFKVAGFNTVDVYVPWNNYEPEEGKFQFDTPSLARFLALCEELELFVYIRPGPYFTNEYDGGGIPAWVFEKTTKKSKTGDGLINLRTDDPDYLYYAERYLKELNKQLLPFLITNGGTIILYGIENEYNWFETFFAIDKLFSYDGGFERDPLQQSGTTAYLTALYDSARSSGIDIPITTCPGNGTISGMGETEGIIPMPNIYTADNTEKKAYDLLNGMHAGSFGDRFKNMPSGSTETDRRPERMQRLIMGGMDGYFGFNMAGFHQEGYTNALVLNNEGLETVIDLSPENVLGLFLSPTVSYFHGVVDYYGAIAPGGTLRNKFYTFRRMNMLLDTLTPLLAGNTLPERTDGKTGEMLVQAEGVGSPEEAGLVHYYYKTAGGTIIAQLLNTGTKEITLPAGALEIMGEKIPKYAPFNLEKSTAIPEVEENAGARLFVYNLPLDELRLLYTTSEILTIRRFNNEILAVLYGPDGAEGELTLTSELPLQLHYKDTAIELKTTTSPLTATYPSGKLLQLQVQAGNTAVRILILPKEAAGRTHITTLETGEVLLIGPTLISGKAPSFEALFEETALELIMLSPHPLKMEGLQETAPYTALTGISRWKRATPPQAAQPAPELIATGKSASETIPDTGCIAAGETPTELEALGIYRGHSYYRAKVFLEKVPEKARLYVEHASDIVGIYLNGHYLTTVAPLGTEIDSNGKNSYAFDGVGQQLVAGTNSLVFRTEIWGHGSFMWPRGKLAGFPGQMPALGYDAVKGLYGEAYISDTTPLIDKKYPLTGWEVCPQLTGEAHKVFEPSFDDSTWETTTIPLTLGKGEIRWYRTTFAASAIFDKTIDRSLSLRLEGSNTKATIYLNGTLIGRWLSDTDWLCRGTWTRCLRTMWSQNDADEFPLPVYDLNAGENVLAIAFEDTSSDSDATGGIIANLSILESREEFSVTGETKERIAVPLRRVLLTLTP